MSKYDISFNLNITKQVLSKKGISGKLSSKMHEIFHQSNQKPRGKKEKKKVTARVDRTMTVHSHTLPLAFTSQTNFFFASTSHFLYLEKKRAVTSSILNEEDVGNILEYSV